MLYSFKFVNRQLHHRLTVCLISREIIKSQSNFQSSDGEAICLLARSAPHVSRGRIPPLPLSNARPAEIEVKMISSAEAVATKCQNLMVHICSKQPF